MIGRLSFQYDERGLLTSSSQGGQLTEIRRDALGRPERTVRRIDDNPSTAATRIERRVYEANGFLRERVLEQVETEGGQSNLTWTYTADDLLRLQTATDPENVVTTRTYDGHGRLRETYISGASSQPYQQIYDYSDNGELVRIETGLAGSGDIAIESRAYDTYERLSQVRDAEGNVTELSYSNNSVVTRREIYDGVSIAQPVASYALNDHDMFGRPLQWTEGGVAVSSAVHLPLSRRTQGPRGAELFEAWSSDGRPSAEHLSEGSSFVYERSWTYDDGLSIGLTDRQGVIQLDRIYARQTYGFLRQVQDGFNLPMVTYEPRLDGTSRSTTLGSGSDLRMETPMSVLGESLGTQSAEGVVRHREYDQARRPRRTGPGGGPSQARQLDYDGVGRLLSMNLRNGASYGFSNFDGRNQAQTVTLPDGATMARTYDKLGRLLTQGVPYDGGSEVESYRYDGLNRLISSRDPSTTCTHDYLTTLGGDRDSTLTTLGTSFTMGVRTYEDLSLSSVRYPGNTEILSHTRTPAGRLIRITDSANTQVVSQVQYALADRPGQLLLGSQIQREDTYDERRNLTQRTYRSGGVVLAEFRYAYDHADREVGRQHIHQAGRTDFFTFDRDSRLVRAELGAQLNASSSAAPWSVMVPTAVRPSPIGGAWRAGDYARTYSYNTRDELLGTTALTWPNASVPLVVQTSTSHMAMGHPETVDGHTRQFDPFGHVTEMVTVQGLLTLQYDGRSRLRRVTRQSDGVVFEYGYRADGILASRRVICGSASGCAPSERVYVYDGLLLLEVHDKVGSGNFELSARYMYADDGDVPVAADFRVGSGSQTQLARHYFIADRVGSIVGVLDASGSWVERTRYDPWGGRTIQTADVDAPAISEVFTDGQGSLFVAFSEAVQPPLGGSVSTAGIRTELAQLSDVLTVSSTSGPTAGQITMEDVPGYVVGSVVKFVPSGTPFRPGANYTVTVNAGSLVDDWVNAVATDTRSVTYQVSSALSGGVPVGSTRSPEVARSVVGNEVGFQAHLHDSDVGLILMRARAFDPMTGQFLQPDPEVHADSVNQYAGMAWDPVNLRDPTGRCFSRALPRNAGLVEVSLGVSFGSRENGFFLDVKACGNLSAHTLVAAGQASIRATWFENQWGRTGDAFRGLTIESALGAEIGGVDVGGFSWSSRWYTSLGLDEIVGTADPGGDRLSKTNQRIGDAYLRLGSFFSGNARIGMSNDSSTFLKGDGGDSYRTASGYIEGSMLKGDPRGERQRIAFGARFNLVTGERRFDHNFGTYHLDNPYGFGTGGRFGIVDMRGTSYENLSRGEISLFIQANNLGQSNGMSSSVGIELGYNSEYFRYWIQNLLAHDILSGDPWVPVDLSKPGEEIIQLQLKRSGVYR